MVDLPQPVLPSTATISPCAISKERRGTARQVPPTSGRGTTLVTPSKWMKGSVLTTLCSPFGDRPVAQYPALDRHERRLHHEHEQHELQRPSDSPCHVEQLLLAQELIA